MAERLLGTCPFCGTVLDEHDGPSPLDRPAPGDVSVCWQCMRVATWTVAESGEELVLRKPTAEEQADYDADDSIRMVIVAMESSATPEQAARRWRSQL